MKKNKLLIQKTAQLNSKNHYAGSKNPDKKRVRTARAYLRTNLESVH